jgi:hypothetical protein
MKAVISRPAFVSFVAVGVLFCANGGVCAESRGSMKLNEDAFAFAARLIKEGHFIADGKGAWSKHRPSVDQENEFIRLHGFGEYAKWHLGINDRYPADTKRRYKFPYSDFNNVHRCGLLAARSRARHYGYAQIENAAAELERAVKQSKSGAAAPRSKDVDANINFSLASWSTPVLRRFRLKALTLPAR